VRAAAFFDMDDTLTVEDSDRLWLRYLKRAGLLTLRHRAAVFGLMVRYRLDLLTEDGLARFYGGRVRGLELSEFERHARAFFDSIGRGAIRKGAADLVEAHRSAGRISVLLTGAIHQIAEPFGEHLNIPHVLATHLEIRGGQFTGRPAGPLCYREGKVRRARAFAEEHGIDLAASWYYGDSITDLPMLQAVGNPVAVSPDRLLSREARRRGWPVVREFGSGDLPPAVPPIKEAPAP